MKLTDEELDFMAVAYAKNSFVLEPSSKRPGAVSPLAKRLLEYGFVTEEQKPKPRNSSFVPDFWLLRPSMKGVQFMRGCDPTDVVRAFIRVDVLSLAVVWIYKWITSVGELPEFLSHRDPDIRTAARIRLEELVRDGGNKPDRP